MYGPENRGPIAEQNDQVMEKFALILIVSLFALAIIVTALVEQQFPIAICFSLSLLFGWSALILPGYLAGHYPPRAKKRRSSRRRCHRAAIFRVIALVIARVGFPLIAACTGLTGFALLYPPPQ